MARYSIIRMKHGITEISNARLTVKIQLNTIRPGVVITPDVSPKLKPVLIAFWLIFHTYNDRTK